jgi:hypothetical protein
MIQPALICLLLIIASWEAEEFDPSDLDACFATVFARLPDEVTVYPSENYYYWKIETPDGTVVRGNLRLAAKRRDLGELSFAVGQGHKVFNAADGVAIERQGRLKYAVSHGGKRVTFSLNRLSQVPPKKFALRQDERFVQRTYDESGVQFILIYNTRFRDFFWLLNEEEGVENPETFREQGGALIGQRTGFVFWQDGDRKLLVAVSAANIDANNEYDGPFDQLADNDAGQTPLRELLLHRDPNLDGQIDQFGNYKNRQPASRVALTNYLKYATLAEALKFLDKAKRSTDPYPYISRAGRLEKNPRP